MTNHIQQLKNLETELRHPAVINSVNDFIRLMERYRKYLELYNLNANALAKKLLRNDYEPQAVDALSYRLYLNSNYDRLVFENLTAATLYLKNDNRQTSDLIDLYCHPGFDAINSFFHTPVILPTKVRSQLPEAVTQAKFESDIDEIIGLLSKLRTGKLASVIPCL